MKNTKMSKLLTFMMILIVAIVGNFLISETVKAAEVITCVYGKPKHVSGGARPSMIDAQMKIFTISEKGWQYLDGLFITKTPNVKYEGKGCPKSITFVNNHNFITMSPSNEAYTGNVTENSPYNLIDGAYKPITCNYRSNKKEASVSLYSASGYPNQRQIKVNGKIVALGEKEVDLGSMSSASCPKYLHYNPPGFKHALILKADNTVPSGWNESEVYEGTMSSSEHEAELGKVTGAIKDATTAVEDSNTTEEEKTEKTKVALETCRDILSNTSLADDDQMKKECKLYIEKYETWTVKGIVEDFREGCGMLGTDVKAWIQRLFGVLQIAMVTIVVLGGILDFTGATASSDDAAMKKAWKKFSTRLVVLAIFLLLPVIIEFIVNAFPVNGLDLKDPTCLK